MRHESGEEEGNQSASTKRGRAVSSSHTVKVCEPRTESGWLGMKKYVTYRVVVSLASSESKDMQSFDVRRRYSDFLWLRQRLLKRYSGLWIPAMPLKTLDAVIGAQSDSSLTGAFVQYRVRGLRLFLHRVLDSEFLRDDPSVKDFLSRKTSSGWSSAKKKAEPAKAVPVESNMSGNSGCAKWLRTIKALKVPEAPAQKMSNMREHLGQLKSSQKNVHQRVLKLCSRFDDVKKEVSKLQDAFSVQASTSKDLKESLSNTGERQDEDAKSSEMEMDLVYLAMAQAFGGWEALIEEKKQQFDTMLQRPMDDRSLQILAMMECTQEHERVMNRYTQAWKSQDKCEFQLKQAEERGQTERVPKLRTDLEKFKDACNAAKKTMNHESAALLRYELPRYGLWSLESSRLSFGQYADAQAKTAERECKIWSQLLDTLGVNFDDTYAEAQKTLANTVYGATTHSVFPPYPGMSPRRESATKVAADDEVPSPSLDATAGSSSAAAATVVADLVQEKDQDDAKISKSSEGDLDDASDALADMSPVPASPKRPPRPARKQKSSSAEEIAVAEPVVTAEKDDAANASSSANDSGMFFDPDAGEGVDDDDDDDDGIFI